MVSAEETHCYVCSLLQTLPLVAPIVRPFILLDRHFTDKLRGGGRGAAANETNLDVIMLKSIMLLIKPVDVACKL